MENLRNVGEVLEKLTMSLEWFEIWSVWNKPRPRVLDGRDGRLDKRPGCNSIVHHTVPKIGWENLMQRRDLALEKDPLLR